MEKILKIEECYDNWVRTENGMWYNLSITDEGNVYFDGGFVHEYKKVVECNYERINNRWEILDL